MALNMVEADGSPKRIGVTSFKLAKGSEAADIDLIEVIQSTNDYESRHWNREIATRYVFKFGDAVLEASFFAHYRDGMHVKNVIELPTSFGCPVGCRHCASSLLRSTRQLQFGELYSMMMYMVADKGLEIDASLLVTFSGIGEGSFQKSNISALCKSIYGVFSGSYFTLTTVGYDHSFIAFVDALARDVPIHYLQISYLHDNINELEKVIPKAKILGFDFQRLIFEIEQTRRLIIRINFVLIDGFNDSETHIANLIAMMNPIRDRVVIRISRLNETDASRLNSLSAAPLQRLKLAKRAFEEAGFTAYVFRSERDDNMNCGQLAWRYGG